MYLEHSFLDELEADAFLSTLPSGTENNQEIREVTDQLFGNGEDDKLLPPQSKSLQEYFKNLLIHKRELLSGFQITLKEVNHKF